MPEVYHNTTQCDLRQLPVGLSPPHLQNLDNAKIKTKELQAAERFTAANRLTALRGRARPFLSCVIV